MQEAFVGSWAQEPHWSAQFLGSLRDLNHRFLDLAAVRGDLAAGRVAALSPAQRAAAAGCPYALFDLRFHDDGYWQSRLQASGPWRVADEAGEADGTAAFVHLALFYAWHVAAGASLKAQLFFGMSNNTAAAFRRTAVHQVPALAAAEALNLSARWSGCTAYWSALTDAAARADPAALRRVQLYGLQLAAAAELPGLCG